MAEIACVISILIVAALAMWPSLVHKLANGLQRLAWWIQFAVWALRAHADTTSEYIDAYRRHYQRRADA